jgi:hypothetical protein
MPIYNFNTDWTTANDTQVLWSWYRMLEKTELVWCSGAFLLHEDTTNPN